MKSAVKLKYILLLYISSLLSQKSYLSAQSFVFPVDTIMYNGDPTKFINLVFMGDGFQAAQLPSFISNVQTLTNYLFSTPPLTQYKNYFNVFAIKVPSTNSGADHPATATDVTEPVFPTANVNTYFNSTFDYASIHRLLVATNNTAIANVVANNVPLANEQLILVNSTYYGGSGGYTSVSSLNSSAYSILVHEFGHTFAGLSDEYYAGNQYAAEKPNMTQQTNPTLVRWKNWLGFGGVGIYQHCCGGNSAQWYRPHNNCIMRTLGAQFCPVCKETIVEMIHQVFMTPVLSVQPDSTSVAYCAQPIKFKLKLAKPIPNTLRLKWFLNGTGIGANIDSMTINSGQLLTGVNNLSVRVLDTTSLTRDSFHIAYHTDTVKWTINFNPLLPPVISANGATTFCQGNSLSLTVGQAASYLWSNGASTQSISVSTSGNYSVTVSSVDGCTATSAAITVSVNALPVAPTIAANGSILTTGSASGIQWYLNGNIISGATTATYNISQYGIYSVIVTDSNGCSAASAEYSYIDVGVSPVSKKEIIPVVIIPNPNKGIFRIETKDLLVSRVKIFNAAGEMVYESALINSEIDLTAQPKGTYLVEVHTQNKVYSRKLIVQ